MTYRSGAVKNGWLGNGIMGAHWMPWHGSGKPEQKMQSYKSNDPAVIDKQTDLMLGEGIGLVVATWQGVQAAFQHSATVELHRQCLQKGMKFALLLDPWIGKIGSGTKEQLVIASLKDTSVQAMLNSPAYIAERAILDFGVGCDYAKVSTAVPGHPVWYRHQHYSWPETLINGRLRTNAEVLTTLASDNQNVNMKMPGLCVQFNDSGFLRPDKTRDYAFSVWDGKAAGRQLLDDAAHFYWSQLAVTPKDSPYLMLVTWNDYDEGTQVESHLAAREGIIL